MDTKYLVNNNDLFTTGDTQIVNTWVNPNENEWKIVTYNGSAVITYDGVTPATWFPYSGVPFSNGTDSCYENTLRGGKIEYTAYVVNNGYGSQFGEISFSRNCATSFISSIRDQTSGGFILDGNWQGFNFANESETSFSMFIQWTARLHYTVENVC